MTKDNPKLVIETYNMKQIDNMVGYLHPLYAESFSEFGTPLYLPESKGWLIKRQIPDTPHFDAMGCYPLFLCKNWNNLRKDIDNLEGELVSIALVIDPFASIKTGELSDVFPICNKFKDHYITDLTLPLGSSVHKKTRHHARRALQDISIEHCEDPGKYLVEWISLYDCLIERHTITGIRAFSKHSFEQLFRTPGLEMFIARLGKKIVGAELFIVIGDVVYAHLAAYNKLGYEYNASYALSWIALHYYSKKFHLLDQGSGTGLQQQEDGLTKYKKRWTTETLPTYFCGRVLHNEIYEDLTKHLGSTGVDYFPAYRYGEFG